VEINELAKSGRINENYVPWASSALESVVFQLQTLDRRSQPPIFHNLQAGRDFDFAGSLVANDNESSRV